MSSFEYLSVLISIVLGLGMSQLLIRLGELIQARLLEEGRVRLYWVQLLWAAVILVGQVQFWWAFFSRREILDSYGFFTFLFFLFTPVLFFLASTLVLPSVTIGQSVDLREHALKTRRWVLGIAALVPLHALVESVWLRGQSVINLPAGLQLLFSLLLGSAAIVRSQRYYALAALASALLLLTFVTLFSLHVS